MKEHEIRLLENFSKWYCEQDGKESWLNIENGKYVSMVSLLGRNSLKLREEEDVFKLFTLALNWNSRKYGRFNAGLDIFKKSDDDGLLSKIFHKEHRTWSDWEKQNNRTNICREVVRSYFYLRDNWENIYRSLIELDKAQNVKEFILNVYEMFKNGNSTPLKVKIFFILREMKSQRILEVDDDFCCIPDNNAREMMNITGLSDRKWSSNPDIQEMIRISKEISDLFNNEEYQLYDMPLFWFYRNRHCCTLNCIIYDECEKKSLGS